MKRALSPAVRAMRPGVFAELQSRIDVAVARGADLVPLHIGDTCAAPPALGGHWTDPAPLAAYGATGALGDARRAVADRIRRLGHGPREIDPDRNVLLGSGATHAIACAARSILGDGDDVLLLAPYWPLAHGILTQTGARIVEVPVTDRLYANPSLDLEAWLEQHRTERTRAIYVITPNNPDGKVLGADALLQIARFAERHDLWVIADEAYADWVYEGEHRSIAALPNMAERTITAYSMSKSHALAGARLGCVIANEDVIAAARRVSVHTVFNVPVSMQRVGIAALGADDSWSRNAIAGYREARTAMATALTAAGVPHRLPDGGAYFFVDLANALAGQPLGRLLEHALDEGVLLTPGDAFGADYATWARLCFTSVPIPRMVEGVARLGRAIQRFAGTGTQAR